MQHEDFSLDKEGRKSKFICVDFDGTIVDHKFPDIGQESPGAFKWLRQFQNMDARIILFTMRSDEPTDMFGNILNRLVLTEAVKYIQSNGINLYGINENPSQASWTSSPKAYGNVYIDDLAVGCPLIQPEGFYRKCVDWSIVGPMVESVILT